MQQKILKIHPNDNLIVALDQLIAGEVVMWGNERYEITHDVPPKHKFAMHDLAPEDPVYMYGVLVGRATVPIRKGEPVTTTNLRHEAQHYGARQTPRPAWPAPDVSRWQNTTFMGYPRGDGSVGTANYWLFIPMVFCENRNINLIREVLIQELGYDHARAYDFDVQTLVQKHRAGASEDDLLTSEIVVTAEEIQSKRAFPNVDASSF